MVTGLVSTILTQKQLTSLGTGTLLMLASRALSEVRGRTGSDLEYAARTMAFKAVRATLSIDRGDIYPNDELVKTLQDVRKLAMSTIKEVR